MAIKAGQILHDANGFVVDRIQTGGVTNLNQNEEKIYELGNFQTVGTIRDIPDLSFELESLDVSTEIEALVTRVDPTTTVAGQEFDLDDAKPIDIISPFKTGQDLYTIVRGIAIPYLTLESTTYRFGTRANAAETFTLRGDSVFYIPGSPYTQTFAEAGVGPYTLTNTALVHTSEGTSTYLLSLCYIRTDGTYRRLFRDDDYTETATTFTLTEAPPAGATIHAVYGSATQATYPQSVHQGSGVKPAAVRGKDIDVYVGTTAATPVLSRFTGVQSFEVTRRVNLENDEEFGNAHYVAQDYDTAEVSGSVTIRPRDPADLWDKIYQVTGVTSTEIIGPLVTDTVPVELRIHHPDTGARLKTIYIPDARFSVPSVQGRVQQKLEVTFNFSGESGDFLVYQGARP